MVGAVRFELTTSWTRTKRASQTTLRPDIERCILPVQSHQRNAKTSLPKAMVRPSRNQNNSRERTRDGRAAVLRRRGTDTRQRVPTRMEKAKAGTFNIQHSTPNSECLTS